MGADAAGAHLSVLQRFLNDCCAERDERDDGEVRYVATTSTLDDWHHRGSHHIVANLSFHVYCMWLYRIELPHRKPGQTANLRFIDVEFAPGDALNNTHVQLPPSTPKVPINRRLALR